MDDVLLRGMLTSYAASPTEDLLNDITKHFLPLSRAIARRVWVQGVEIEDLEQVAAMALVKAIKRFEPDRGLKFSTYATPTILGEVRNYMRDRAGSIRLNRDVRTQLGRMQKVSERLAQEKGREPTLMELASAMELAPEALLSLLDEREMTQTVSLNSVQPGDEDAMELEEKLGATDAGFEAVERQEWYRWALAQLNEKEQQLIRLRYEARLGQRETAARLGVSQMQVSRMERRLLERLKTLLQEES